MKKANKLALRTETLRVLTSDHLSHAAGGLIVVRQTNTCACPVTIHPTTNITNACTIGTSGTSVINPSGG